MACTRIDQEIQEHLIELGGGAGDRRDHAEIFLDGDAATIKPAADHLEGGPDRLVHVGLVDLGAVQPGETAEVLHDVGHALDALPRALDELAQVLLHISQVALVGDASDLTGQLGRAASSSAWPCS